MSEPIPRIAVFLDGEQVEVAPNTNFKFPIVTENTYKAVYDPNSQGEDPFVIGGIVSFNQFSLSDLPITLKIDGHSVRIEKAT